MSERSSERQTRVDGKKRIHSFGRTTGAITCPLASPFFRSSSAAVLECCVSESPIRPRVDAAEPEPGPISSSTFRRVRLARREHWPKHTRLRSWTWTWLPGTMSALESASSPLGLRHEWAKERKHASSSWLHRAAGTESETESARVPLPASSHPRRVAGEETSPDRCAERHDHVLRRERHRSSHLSLLSLSQTRSRPRSARSQER